MNAKIISAPVVLLCLAALLMPAVAPASAEDDFWRSNAPNPNAPAELAQFAFLVGEWDAQAYRIGADGKEVQFGYADWRISYILNGFAIQDVWIYKTLATGEVEYGTMFRTYCPEAGHWTMVEQRHSDLKFLFMTAEKVGETMVMRGELDTPQGKVPFRRVFYNIKRDSFEWRTDFSSNGGKTWNEGAFFLRVTRRK
jgi:hypothetical protein